MSGQYIGSNLYKIELLKGLNKDEKSIKDDV